MSQNKEPLLDKKPVKKSWWVRIANYFSDLFKSEEQKLQDQTMASQFKEVVDINYQKLAKVKDEIKMQSEFIKLGMTDPTFRNEMKEKLANTSGEITKVIPSYLSQLNKDIKKNEIPTNSLAILSELKRFIDEVNTMNKGDTWMIGDKTVTGSWAEWYTAMTNSIENLQIKISNPTGEESFQSVEKTVTRASPPPPPTSRDQSNIEVGTSVPTQSETEKPESTPQPVAALRASSRPIQDTTVKERPPGTRPLPKVDTATGTVEKQDARVEESQSVSGAAPLSRPSGRGPLPTPGQGPQAPSTKESPSRVSAKQVGTAPLARPSGRPLPIPGQGSPASQTSTKQTPDIVSAQPGEKNSPLSRASGRPLPNPGDENKPRASARTGGAHIPVRRKPPAVDQPKPLRVSQTDNLLRESQGSPQEIEPPKEAPIPLPRRTQGSAPQPGIPAKTAPPQVPPRTPQAQLPSGQVESLKRERDKNTGEAPAFPELPPETDPQARGGSTSAKN